MSGPILLQLENLGSLVELYLGGNYFSGTIPSTLSMCLDPHHVYCVCVFCFFFFSFLFFFFFFYAFCFRQGTMITIPVLYQYCLHTVAILFMYLKILKIGPMVLFIHLKIILLQYFQFSVFSFNKNKLYKNGPLVF